MTFLSKLEENWESFILLFICFGYCWQMINIAWRLIKYSILLVRQSHRDTTWCSTKVKNIWRSLPEECKIVFGIWIALNWPFLVQWIGLYCFVESTFICLRTVFINAWIFKSAFKLSFISVLHCLVPWFSAKTSLMPNHPLRILMQLWMNLSPKCQVCLRSLWRNQYGIVFHHFIGLVKKKLN